LNIDEVENIEKTWREVAKKIGTDVDHLKNTIQPMAALFSIGEHARSLLFALSDGALPSNVGGGYNLRVILRRALMFIDKYGWDIDLPTVCKWHAEYLKPLFPELMGHLDDVQEILDVEEDKYKATKQKTHSIVEGLIKTKEEITEKKLLELYDSNGIAPELIRDEAKKLGKTVVVPENFYSLVASLHENVEQAHATTRTEKLELEGVPETRAKYFEDYKDTKFEATIVKIIDNKVILDETLFYPTSGGQLHDTGKINGEMVVDVFKQGNIIVHVMDTPSKLKQGQKVKCVIDADRRIQLAQHHTATHIVNAAARRVLGNHVNQAGAKKTVEKAHIDLTHYQSLTEDELKKIEQEANKITEESIPMRLRFMPRDEAEKKYGMAIYQGGVVPGKELRIVEIPEVDVECCGGTHLHNTNEVGKIKIVKSSKIQDGIVRIVFTAGKAAMQEEKQEESIVKQAAKLLKCSEKQVPARTEELFRKWKTVVKKKKPVDTKELTATEEFAGEDVLVEVCKILQTQPEYVIKTLERFSKELKEA
ncbi:alanine--tRNA ligase, partial [Candidatus Woesearchaeota archaeon]|nr:alanine--tRNA ligase [Candidatus Woesearchaeota archaeon]